MYLLPVQRSNMPTIHTLGHPSRRTEFTYTGCVKEGVTLEFSGRPRISDDFFQAIIQKFKGETIPGGFSMTNPTPGGLGVWVEHHSQKHNHVSLYPRHASFIAAILVHEKYITSSLKRNAVMLHFP
jgi:hypothetical protein